MSENEQPLTNAELYEATQKYVVAQKAHDTEAMHVAGNEMQVALNRQASSGNYQSQLPSRRRR